MTITLKLYSLLSSYLPAGAAKNQVNIPLNTEDSIKDIIDRYHIPFKMCHLILVNGVYSTPLNAHMTKLSDGDVLAIWPPVAGG